MRKGKVPRLAVHNCCCDIFARACRQTTPAMCHACCWIDVRSCTAALIERSRSGACWPSCALAQALALHTHCRIVGTLRSRNWIGSNGIVIWCMDACRGARTIVCVDFNPNRTCRNSLRAERSCPQCFFRRFGRANAGHALHRDYNTTRVI